MKRFRTTGLVTLLAAIVLLTGSLQHARGQNDEMPETPAQEAQAVFAVYPEGGAEGQYFEAEVAPGESHELNLALLNAGEGPIALLTYPADAYSMTNGGMGVGFQEQERTDQTTWLTFPEGVVEVPAGEEHLVPFTVTVPEGTAPGQYVTAIGVETTEAYSVGDSSAFSQVLRKVIAVAIMVPGPINAAFDIGTPELTIIEGQTVLRLPIQNTGNIRVRPAGTVVLSDANGGQLATGTVAMGSVYAGDTAAYEMWIGAALPVAEYTVSVALIDPDTSAEASLDASAVNVIVPEPSPEPEAAVTPTVVAVTPTPIPLPVTIESATVTPNADPIQFANVAITISNTGDFVTRSRVTLSVSRDGELVEEMVLDDNLPLPVGTTSVEQRYIPPTGWESGTWTFSVTVHAVNQNSDVETLLVTADEIATIEVP